MFRLTNTYMHPLSFETQNRSHFLCTPLSRLFTNDLQRSAILSLLTNVLHRGAKYFANHKQSLTGATTLLVKIFKHYGDPGWFYMFLVKIFKHYGDPGWFICFLSRYLNTTATQVGFICFLPRYSNTTATQVGLYVNF